MNKQMKQIAQIKDSNLLLNKFIMFRYVDGNSSTYYVYKIEGTKLITCNIFYNNSKKASYFQLHDFFLKTLNEDIEDSLKNNYYNIHII